LEFFFGAALASGDFNGDGMDDLAMGNPTGDTDGRVGVFVEGGTVRVMEGPLSPGVSRVQFWTQSRIFPGRDQFDEIDGDGSPSESGDRFGHAMAAGDFNADGRDDLAIGSPRETLLLIPFGETLPTQIGIAGAVTVIYGSATGLSRNGGRAPQFWTQQFNVEDEPSAGDWFGASLTAWNFGRNEFRCLAPPSFQCGAAIVSADLAIGVRLENFGSIVNAGAVNVLYGSFFDNGLTSTEDQLWHQESHPSLDPVDGREDEDRFSTALH
jgi:hypothetical protein